ncbi:uncharacterized protein LOC144256008 [Urocitellus parryii]
MVCREETVKASAQAAAPSPWNSSRTGLAYPVPLLTRSPNRLRALRPAPPAPPSAPQAPLLPPPLVYLELNRRLLPRQGARRAATPCNGLPPLPIGTRGWARAARQGRPVSAGHGSPAAPPPGTAAARGIWRRALALWTSGGCAGPDENDYAYSSATQSMLSDSWKTSVNICGLIKTPGVWDPFVKSYVGMLEFYGDQDKARKILTDYAYDEKFPSNPNANIYLYNFLKKEKAPRAKLLSVLKMLLEKFVEECRFPRVPDAICCYQKCRGYSKIQIYITDPDFKGFIQISCCQYCKIEFHMNCWKKLKTTTFNDKIDKFEHKVIKEKVPPRPILKQKCSSLEKLRLKEDKKLKRKIQKQEANN